MQVYDTLKSLTRFASREALYRQVVTPEVEPQIARMPKPVGSFGYDAWGYNENAAKLGLGVVKLLYDHYFRVVARGDRKSAGEGKSVSVRVDLGGRRIVKQKTKREKK